MVLIVNIMVNRVYWRMFNYEVLFGIVLFVELVLIFVMEVLLNIVSEYVDNLNVWFVMLCFF